MLATALPNLILRSLYGVQLLEGEGALFKLGCMDPKFKSLKSGCHLGSEKDLLQFPSKRFKGSLFLISPNLESERELEVLVWRVTARNVRTLEKFGIKSCSPADNKTSR